MEGLSKKEKGYGQQRLDCRGGRGQRGLDGNGKNTIKNLKMYMYYVIICRWEWFCHENGITH